ncbi:DMT family transporter [Crenobacter sp. SG2305]|uniref:DMT family transporter n=1 Tax=Crenobacter oryzisoli TaxID=3056844 RepID=UPI0025AA77A8|nr:DMT family transporter [Crenobacter sp. SG2305]MDN0082536.1 DMT family transporter [Crenobacter sp. SG2305]
MNSYLTIALLAAAGVALVVQNLLMVRITESVSTVVITLVINSSMGLALLFTVLLLRNGLSGVTEAVGALRPWSILPGVLGSFFVFAGIIGYQKVGAAATIAVLVASQLIAGLLVDACKADAAYARTSALSFLGAGLLVVGAFLIARGRV